MIYKMHYMDPPYTVENNETIDGDCFVRVGSNYGRFIFNHSDYLININCKKNVTIKNCYFDGGGTAVGVTLALDGRIVGS